MENAQWGVGGYGHKITDWDAFRSYVEANGDLPQTAMAEELGVSRMTVHRGLKVIGYTRKKDVQLS